MAVLLKLEEKESDFLSGKVDARVELSPADSKKSEQKERQATYRKAQYEKQKARAKEKKGAGGQTFAKTAFTYPPEVEAARAYFAQNGFELPHPLELTDVVNARNTLARVFHPDKGGSHAEGLELLASFDVIRRYLES